MNKKLPARPNLEHLKGQAKSLLAAIKSQDSEAQSAFANEHPEENPSDPKLADAQLVIARQNGFDCWPKLVHHVDTLRDLEGTWGFRSLVVGGNQIPDSMLGNSKIVMNGDRFNTLSPEGDYLGEFAINIESSPNEIDIHFIEGPHAGQFCYGIFELSGDNLTFCLGLVGASRPTEFNTDASPMHALEHLVRESKEANVTLANPDAAKPPLPEVEANPTGFDVVTDDLEKLQGEWLAVKVVKNGEPLPDKFLAYGKRICRGNHVLVTFGSPMVDALAKTHGSQDIDYLIQGGPMKGQIQLGIYKLDGNEATFCMSEPGTPRPTDFTSESGSGHTLTTWRKK
jgi:uncharacterized protein (TIGR03067 family)